MAAHFREMLDLNTRKANIFFFIDSDDLMIDTALETLYNVAENYQSDVVYMEKYFTCGEEIIPTKINLSAWCYADSFVEEPAVYNALTTIF